MLGIPYGCFCIVEVSEYASNDFLMENERAHFRGYGLGFLLEEKIVHSFLELVEVESFH